MSIGQLQDDTTQTVWEQKALDDTRSRRLPKKRRSCRKETEAWSGTGDSRMAAQDQVYMQDGEEIQFRVAP